MNGAQNTKYALGTCRNLRALREDQKDPKSALGGPKPISRTGPPPPYVLFTPRLSVIPVITVMKLIPSEFALLKYRFAGVSINPEHLIFS